MPVVIKHTEMEITIRSTEKIVILQSDALAEGVPARLWEGETKSGIKVHCFVTRIAIDSNELRIEEFEQELIEQQAPSTAMEAYPTKLIL